MSTLRRCWRKLAGKTKIEYIDVSKLSLKYGADQFYYSLAYLPQRISLKFSSSGKLCIAFSCPFALMCGNEAFYGMPVGVPYRLDYHQSVVLATNMFGIVALEIDLAGMNNLEDDIMKALNIAFTTFKCKCEGKTKELVGIMYRLIRDNIETIVDYVNKNQQKSVNK